MIASATITDLAILNRHPAKSDNQLTCLCDTLPAGLNGHHFHKGTDNMRHDYLSRRKAIGIYRAGIAANTVQKPVNLALRMVKPPGAGPPIRPRINRLIAMVVNHPAQLIPNNLFSLFPADCNKCVGATLFRRCTWSARQI